MCGRYLSKEQRAIERELHFLDVKDWPEWVGSYNIAPAQLAPVVIATPRGNICELMRFGLVPFTAHGVPPKLSTINARVENLVSGAFWRGPWQRGQRCLVIANAFYEWHVLADGRTKQPYLVHATDQDTFTFAGVWDRSVADDGKECRSFAIITLPASPFMAEIHNAKQREPAMLAHDAMEAWLRGTPDQAHAALKQYPDERLAAYPVSLRVNDPKNNDEALTSLAPIVRQAALAF